MTDPNELIVQLIGCLPMIDEGPDHKLWCSVRGDWLRAAVAALTPAPAQPEPNDSFHGDGTQPEFTVEEAIHQANAAARMYKGMPSVSRTLVAEIERLRAEPLPAGGEPVAWVVRELCSRSPMQAFECSAVDAQATAMRWAEDGYEAEIVELVERAPLSLTDAQCDAIWHLFAFNNCRDREAVRALIRAAAAGGA